MRLFRTSAILLLTGLGVAAGVRAQTAGATRMAVSEALLAAPEDGRWSAPLPSPDGRYVAFTTPSFTGLYLLETATGSVKQLSDLPGAGFRPSWSPDSRSIAFRASPGGGKQLVVVAHPDGVKEPASPLLDSVSVPFWQGLELCYFVTRGDAPELRRIGPGPEEDAASSALPAAAPSGRLRLVSRDGKVCETAADPAKKFFLPVLSEDGRRFVVECLDGHLYLGLTKGGPLEDLGAGSWPSFVRGDSALLFEKTADDGHAITASALYLMDLATLEAVPVTATKERIERHAALAGDGHTLYFDADGVLYKGHLP